MSFLGSAKEFFGLGPIEHTEEDAYYDDGAYRDGGSTAYDRDVRPARDERYTPAAPARPQYTRNYTPHIVTASPRTYNDAKEIGEPFRDGDAVVMDLTDLNTADAKRIVDFAAGLCFALRGNMHNLSRGVDTQRRLFAIVPENAGLEKDDLKRAAQLR